MNSSIRGRWWWPLQLLCLLFFSCPGCLLSAAEHRGNSSSRVVTRLPGFDGPLPFGLETGYVEVNESTGVRLFYYFVKSEKDPKGDPLVLWMTGGPSCSSLYGLTHQIGPFQFVTEGYRGGLPTLIYRPETWTKVSNIIFVDSPVGTGFSYATSEEGAKSSDTKAAKQLVIFLRKWLHEHPRFLLNPLYIGGDSYGGMIVPILTLAIDKSKEAGEKPLFNLKGYIAGNPKTDDQYDEGCKIPYFHGMGLISDELYERAKERCKGKYTAPINAPCAESIQAIHDCTKDINMLHILEPLCKEVFSPRIDNMAAADGVSRLMVESGGDDDIFDFKCRKASYVVLKAWANDETVRETLGVHKGTIGRWKRCNFDIPYTKDVLSSVDYHLKLRKKGYRAIIYSGDHDAGISFIATQGWIRSLNLSIVDDWRPWQVAGQVAGFTRSYASNLTFATVKGAGHTGAEYKPKECLEMFVRWMSGNPL